MGNQFVAAESELEKAIAAIWQRVLGIDVVGVRDNFRDVGGTSLKAVQIVAALHDQLHRDLSVLDLFEFPTIQDLARKLSGQSTSSLSAEVSVARSRAEKRRERQIGRRRRARRSL